jgi:hypothetical protein
MDVIDAVAEAQAWRLRLLDYEDDEDPLVIGATEALHDVLIADGVQAWIEHALNADAGDAFLAFRLEVARGRHGAALDALDEILPDLIEAAVAEATRALSEP